MAQIGHCTNPASEIILLEKKLQLTGATYGIAFLLVTQTESPGPKLE
jgi:hypothetical protein